MGPKKLVLHFDVNETIMVSDAAGDTLEDCVNRIVCKCAFVRLKDGGSAEHALECADLSALEWMNGVPIDGSSSWRPISNHPRRGWRNGRRNSPNPSRE